MKVGSGGEIEREVKVELGLREYENYGCADGCV
jgi:hypothetical protein